MTTPTNTTTNGYIETRPEAIAAIHKSITEKWNPICMGRNYLEVLDCELCEIYNNGRTGDCHICPLRKAYERRESTPCHCVGVYEDWVGDMTPQAAEAMLEALVQLLPESERKIYGG